MKKTIAEITDTLVVIYAMSITFFYIDHNGKIHQSTR